MQQPSEQVQLAEIKPLLKAISQFSPKLQEGRFYKKGRIVYCYFCSWTSRNPDDQPVHDTDCPWKLASEFFEKLGE